MDVLRSYSEALQAGRYTRFPVGGPASGDVGKLMASPRPVGRDLVSKPTHTPAATTGRVG